MMHVVFFYIQYCSLWYI